MTLSKQSFSLRGPLILAGALLGLAALPAQCLAGARFVCHGAMTQTCHFAVLRGQGARTDFTLRRGETKTLDDVAAGGDQYMVSVNFAPPAQPAACSRVPASAKRSAWCKLSKVGAQDND